MKYEAHFKVGGFLVTAEYRSELELDTLREEFSIQFPDVKQVIWLEK